MKFVFCCGLFLAVYPTFAEELRVSTAAVAGVAAKPGKNGDFDIPESTEVTNSRPVQVSEGMMKKIRKLEKEAAEEKGQDDAALGRISGKIGLKLATIGLNDAIQILADKSVDWRVRFCLITTKAEMNPDFRLEEHLPALLRILLDKAEHPRVRGLAAHMIIDPAKENETARAALAEVAFDTSTPSELVASVMSVLGVVGIDDVDRLMAMNRPQHNLNDLGLSLNAIRALCRSKNPKAADLLMKIFNESAPDSFFNATAIDELACVVMTYPEKRKKLEPVLVPKLLKLLDNRSYIGASRHRAAELLILMKRKEAYKPITRWFLPVSGEIAEAGKGGDGTDVTLGAKFLADLCDKRGIRVLEKVLKDFPKDPRFLRQKKYLEDKGQKYPEDAADYKLIKERLERLKKCDKIEFKWP